jgi:hypothetical protein
LYPAVLTYTSALLRSQQRLSSWCKRLACTIIPNNKIIFFTGSIPHQPPVKHLLFLIAEDTNNHSITSKQQKNRYMKASTISELKQELVTLPAPQLTELCLRLAKFKKENKELLTYLLFEAHDTNGYIQSVKHEITVQFDGLNQSNVYFIKKSLRKILRITNKYIRYSGLPVVEIELLLFFLSKMTELNVSINSNQIVLNIYKNQLKKTEQAIAGLHEDLQYDYLKAFKKAAANYS